VLEITPPELAADIFDRGFILAGGGANLYGLPETLEQQLKIKARIPQDPGAAVADGLTALMGSFDELEPFLL